MRKEVLIAILIGFVFGLVVTFGIWTANRTLKEKQTTQVSLAEEVTPTPEVSPIPTPSFFLEITSPENEALMHEAKTILVGKTEPGSMVAVLSEKGEDIIDVAPDGTFESPLSLTTGTNEITVISFGLEGEKVSKTLNIVYTTAEI